MHKWCSFYVDAANSSCVLTFCEHPDMAWVSGPAPVAATACTYSNWPMAIGLKWLGFVRVEAYKTLYSCISGGGHMHLCGSGYVAAASNYPVVAV